MRTSPQWSRAPQALPQMLCALELALVEPATVILAGDPTTPEFQALAAVLHEKPGPRRALLCADGGDGQPSHAAQPDGESDSARTNRDDRRQGKGAAARG